MDHTYDARTPSRPTNDRNRLHRSDSDFESIPGQRGLGTRQHGERVREVTKWSLGRVGPFFAGRDHTTVLHSVRRMEDRASVGGSGAPRSSSTPGGRIVRRIGSHSLSDYWPRLMVPESRRLDSLKAATRSRTVSRSSTTFSANSPFP